MLGRSVAEVAGFSTVAVVLASGCAKQGPENKPPPATEASVAKPEPTSAQDASISTSAASDAGAVVAVADAGAADAGEPEKPVKVKIVTIGMHVGGGPYDEPTKEPIRRSVEPHFAELAKCWRLVPKPKQADAGVDLVIEARGGRAKVSNPRSTIEGEGFKPCVVAFFESIDFERPKTGRSTVSYSVRFIP
jgi:hypothetical protein